MPKRQDPATTPDDEVARGSRANNGAQSIRREIQARLSLDPIGSAVDIDGELVVDRRTPPRILGQVISLNGMHAIVASRLESSRSAEGWSIGHLVSVAHRSVRIVGIVCELRAADATWNNNQDNIAHVTLELAGEVEDGPDGPVFTRGIRSFPPLGAVAHRIRAADLAAVYSFRGKAGAEIGRLTQNVDIPACIGVDELVSRHFSLVGATGVGKTTAVSMLIKESLKGREKLRAIILDPHNEYSKFFRGECKVYTADTLELPHWMFRVEEIADIVYSGRTPTTEESDALYELIRTARTRFAGANVAARQQSIVRRPSAIDPARISGDSPTPFRTSDLFAIIEEWTGKLDLRFERADLRSLKHRLTALTSDSRFSFMFGDLVVEDTLGRVLSQLFRIPFDDARVSIIELAGLPNEVVNSVVSVIARLSFEIPLWSRSEFQTLLVCEEAHRYISNDASLGFKPTRRAIGRIAKEGRKYGASLAVVTQRPSEIDPTVLSQCSTMFAMRLPNEADKAIIRSAIPESSASTIGFISSIANQEAIAFGEAVPTPMRIKFKSLDVAKLASEHEAIERPNTAGAGLRTIINRLRGE